MEVYLMENSIVDRKKIALSDALQLTKAAVEGGMTNSSKSPGDRAARFLHQVYSKILLLRNEIAESKE